MAQRVINSKVFGIGLNKTGTTTLGVCGKILDYRVKKCDRALLEDVILRNDFTRIKKVVGEHDLFEDWPWPLIFEELDQLFPGSKFILTTRKDDEQWLASLKSHSMTTPPIGHCRKLAYGYNYPNRHERSYLDFYRNHNEKVRDYFKGREENFMEVVWEYGDGWEKLCGFLECPVPTVPFPHANKGEDRQPRFTRPLINRILSVLWN